MLYLVKKSNRDNHNKEVTFWWHGERVDEDRIRKKTNAARKKEVDSGITPRSDNLIDYTTFGELSQLITDNWDLFDPIFQSKTAVSNVTNQLNLLRGPIAHLLMSLNKKDLIWL